MGRGILAFPTCLGSETCQLGFTGMDGIGPGLAWLSISAMSFGAPRPRIELSGGPGTIPSSRRAKLGISPSHWPTECTARELRYNLERIAATMSASNSFIGMAPTKSFPSRNHAGVPATPRALLTVACLTRISLVAGESIQARNLARS